MEQTRDVQHSHLSLRVRGEIWRGVNLAVHHLLCTSSRDVQFNRE